MSDLCLADIIKRDSKFTVTTRDDAKFTIKGVELSVCLADTQWVTVIIPRHMVARVGRALVAESIAHQKKLPHA